MTDLNATVRANVQRIQHQRGLNDWQMGVAMRTVMEWHPSQYRTQMHRDFGFTLTTVERWARALNVDPLMLLTSWEPQQRIA